METHGVCDAGASVGAGSCPCRREHAYFPNGFQKGSDIKKLIAKISKRERDEHALDNIQSTVSQPFTPPDFGRNIAIKAITNTGAEMTTTIDEGW